MFDLRAIDNQTLADTVARALRPHVGPAATYGYAEAAAAIGVTERAMTSWCRAQTPPQSHKLIRLMAWLGPIFTSEILGMAGLQASAAEPPADDTLALNRETAGLVHEIADAMADGHIDHNELRRIKAKGRGLLPMLSAFVAEETPRLRVVGAK